MKEKTAARGGPRRPMIIEGSLIVGSGAAARTIRVVTCDVGAGGASIESPEPLGEGTAVTLQLALTSPKEAPPRMITLAAAVTRAEGENPCRLALSFAGAHPAAIEAFKRFIVRARDGAHR